MDGRMGPQICRKMVAQLLLGLRREERIFFTREKTEIHLGIDSHVYRRELQQLRGCLLAHGQVR